MSFHLGEVVADAQVDATTERQLINRVAGDVEPVGVGVVALVAVGAAVHHEHPRSRRQRHPTDVLIRGRHPGEVMNRCVQPKDLIERARDQSPIAPQQVPLIGMLGEQVHRRPDRVHCGVDPRPRVRDDRQGLAPLDQLGSATTRAQRARLRQSHRLLDEHTERLHTRADAIVHCAHHVEGRLCEVRQRLAFLVGKACEVPDHGEAVGPCEIGDSVERAGAKHVLHSLAGGGSDRLGIRCERCNG